MRDFDTANVLSDFSLCLCCYGSHLAAETNGLAQLTDIPVAAEEFVFQTWTLNRHPEVIPLDNNPRDVACYIVAGHKAGEATSHSFHDATSEGYYIFKRLSHISPMNEQLRRVGGTNYKQSCPPLNISLPGLEKMQNQTRVWTRHADVPSDRGLDVMRGLSCGRP